MKTRNEYHVHIEGGQNPLTLNLKELWRYRDLIVLFTRRTIALVYKQTVLGPLWLLLRPLFTSVVYAAVFKGVARMSTEGVPALLFYLTSHALRNLLSSSLRRNASTFTANAHIFGKVYFPRLAMSVSSMLTSLFEFLVQCAMILVLLLVYVCRGMVRPHWEWIWTLPLLLLHVGLMGMGLGVLVSSLTTKYRDLTFVVEFGVTLWMYVTPVVYPLSQLAQNRLMNTLAAINPMTAPMELFRYVLIGQGSLRPGMFAVSGAITLLALLGGMLTFNRVERTFIDTI